MASLTNTKIKNTFVSLLKVADNGQLDASLQDITDGVGNVTGVQLNTGGDLAASGTVSFGSLKDTGENITIAKFVDAADGIGSNNNDTTVPTSAAVVSYVASQITLEDLDFAGDAGTGAVDLDSQTLTIQGTANEIETVASNQTLTIGLPSTIIVNVTGNLTGNVNATSVLIDGVIGTTQATSDNSTKVATTAFVKSVLTLENLDIAGGSGTGSVDLDSQVLTIAGTTNEVETSASGQTITVGLPSDVTIGNNLTVTTNATVSGILGVTGAAGIDGNFDIATNKFTVQAATGNTAVAGTLGVTGNTTLSTLDATGLASLDGGIDVDGAFTVADASGNISTSGTLGVTGTSTLGVINATGLASLDGGVDVDGVFTVADTTGNVSTTGTLAAGATTITGLLDVVGEVQGTFLDINGNGELSGNFAVDTDTLFVDATNDRVGINKTNPAVALDVTGAITSSSTITATTLAGTLSTAAQANITSVGTLSSLAVSGNLTVDTNTLFVDAANNRVGIGTTSFGSFDVAIINGSSSVANDFNLKGPNTSQVRLSFSDPEIDGVGQIGYNHATNAMSFVTNNALSMFVNSSGNVGIGTSSPDAKLQVVGGTTGGTSFDTMVLLGGASGVSGSGAKLYLSGASTAPKARAAVIEGVTEGASNAHNMVFSTSATGATPTERMRITSGGGVEITQNNAAQPLIYAKQTGTSGFTSFQWSGNNGSDIGALSTFAGSIYIGRWNGGNGSNGEIQINSSGVVVIGGALSKGSGSFKIDHPLEDKKDTHHLVHSFVESPQANNIYRGKVQLVDGKASVNLDEVSTMTEGTFAALNRDIHTYTSNESDWDAVRGSVEGNILTIECQNAESNAVVSWLVIGERQDKHMYDTSWTDENGKVIVEPLKEIQIQE